MAPELFWLALTGALTALLWVPFAVGRTLVVGPPVPAYYHDPRLPELPAWVRRCDRAHANAVESFGPFAALVLVAHVSGAADALTAAMAALYFWARVAHAVVYWLGIPYVRTLAFAAGLAATLAIFVQLVLGLGVD